MTKFVSWRTFGLFMALLFAVLVLPGPATAAPPVVKTVPWIPGQPTAPHDTYSGKVITLKGTADAQGADIQFTWDFGDGSPPFVGTVTDKYVIEVQHAYTGLTGTVFTARLTVQNLTTTESGSQTYFVQMRDKDLGVEVNMAIDEGLWYLHKNYRRYDCGSLTCGDWNVSYGNGFYGQWAANINAFFVNGHTETGDASNPYTDTVQRAMRTLISTLYAGTLSPTNIGDPEVGQASPNGLFVSVNQSYGPYQLGMLIDAIVASGTPDAVAQTGPANVIGRTYKSIVQDMVDFYSYCADPWKIGGLNFYTAGWRYNCQDNPPDNTASQWGAIGLLAAERSWGITVPQYIKDYNKNWLAYSQNSAGWFGYSYYGDAPWGVAALTASGLVQSVMDGIGRGSSYTVPSTGYTVSWNKAESYIRDNLFHDGGNYTNNLLRYYYGLLPKPCCYIRSRIRHIQAIPPSGFPIRSNIL